MSGYLRHSTCERNLYHGSRYQWRRQHVGEADPNSGDLLQGFGGNDTLSGLPAMTTIMAIPGMTRC
jgi:hypothetical protein